jgi:hypothetical protein
MPMSPRLLRPRASGTAVHPDALDWMTRVTANGGTVSPSTLTAVSTFCASIASAGIRDRFYRLNLFCGNSDASLIAVRTPLYLGQSLGGTQHGNTTDTNANFVAGDYAETGTSTGGLKGNGTNKLLRTGLNPVAVGFSATSFHMACYAQGTEATGASRVMLATNSAGNAGILGWLGAGSQERATFPNVSLNAPGSGHDGMLGGVATASGSVYYRNSSSVVTGAVPSGPYVNDEFCIFCSPNLVLFSLARYLRAYSIGIGMTFSEWSSYNTAMQTFQTALGRNV